LRDYGQTAKYVHSELGLNSRLDEMHAAILRQVFLPRIAEYGARRRAVAHRYLAGISHPSLRLPKTKPGFESAWHLFPVRVTGSAPAFVEHLKTRGVGSARHYPCLIPDQTAMGKLPFEVVGNLPVARDFAENEVSIPLHTYLSQAEIETIIEACNTWNPR
jgi:dTDP-3-amino-3,4,6-trideoxy-alpha-D-glucose transaminase